MEGGRGFMVRVYVVVGAGWTDASLTRAARRQTASTSALRNVAKFIKIHIIIPFIIITTSLPLPLENLL